MVFGDRLSRYPEVFDFEPQECERRHSDVETGPAKLRIRGSTQAKGAQPIHTSTFGSPPPVVVLHVKTVALPMPAISGR
jgi:hypothetical protein